MEENAAAYHTALNAAQALGRGFDVNYDTRLLYCKGVAGSRVVEIDEDHTRDLSLYDNLVLPNVSRDINNFQESGGRDGSSACNYNEMLEYFNRKANIPGNAPLGSFNVAFSFTGAKHFDATTTKTLCMDGFFIPLARLQLMNSSLVLQESVKRAVPASWDPPALASFIENFGTHIITSVTIGGKDVIYVKQHLSSPLSTMEIKSYVHDIGNQRFSSTENLTSSGLLKYKDKSSDPSIFNSQGIFPQPTNAPYIAGNGKEVVFVPKLPHVYWYAALTSQLSDVSRLSSLFTEKQLLPLLCFQIPIRLMSATLALLLPPFSCNGGRRRKQFLYGKLEMSK